jgi:hypothetical protein
MNSTNRPDHVGDTVTFRNTVETKAAIEAIIKAQQASGDWRATISSAVKSALLFYAGSLALTAAQAGIGG